ncbi:MAG: sigma-70 family RNA polymerase sigma factor [Myxococcota bacterium]
MNRARGEATREETLVRAALDGDARAYDQIYSQHAQRLYRTCHALLGNGADAEEAVQEVFVRAFRKLDSFNFRSQLSTWLHGIAVRICLNLRRGRRRRERLDAAVAQCPPRARRDTSPDEQAQASELARRFHQALGQLPEKKRIPFLLFHAEGFDLAKTAAITSASVQTTHARIQSAREVLLAAALEGTEP